MDAETFLRDLTTSPDLKSDLHAFLEKEGDAARSVVNFAAGKGYRFDLGELEVATRQLESRLSETELAHVSGGQLRPITNYRPPSDRPPGESTLFDPIGWLINLFR